MPASPRIKRRLRAISEPLRTHTHTHTSSCSHFFEHFNNVPSWKATQGTHTGARRLEQKENVALGFVFPALDPKKWNYSWWLEKCQCGETGWGFFPPSPTIRANLSSIPVEDQLDGLTRAGSLIVSWQDSSLVAVASLFFSCSVPSTELVVRPVCAEPVTR